MTSTNRTPREVIAAAVAETASDVDDAGAMCTGWVLVAEWVGSDGKYWLSNLSDNNSPSWRIRGMLAEVLDRPDDGDGE